MRKLVLLLFAFFASITAPITAFAYEPAPEFAIGSTPEVDFVLHNAESVLVMDAETGEVLFESDGRSRRYPASITKIMTALLVLEMADDLNERVVFSSRAVDLPYYAGRLWIYEGECMSVLEALYGIMLPSANDVARALAEHFAGSEAEFVAQMNRRALELGATNTNFVNPCGLPGNGQFTTALDIALIMREAVQDPLFVEIVSTPTFTLPPSAFHDEPREMRHSNLMVHPERDEFNPYIIGGKTGFTNAAQHTLVSYAARDGRELIISVLFASPRAMIFSDTAALIDYVFELAARAEVTEEEIETVEEIYEPEEAVAAFLYIPENMRGNTPENMPETPETIRAPDRNASNADAVIASTLSLLTVAIALVALFFMRKKL